LRTAPEIMPTIEECQRKKRYSLTPISATWQLIVSALEWSLGKTETEIRERILRCELRRDTARLLASNWQIIISSLEWVLGEEERDPISMRKIVYGGVL